MLGSNDTHWTVLEMAEELQEKAKITNRDLGLQSQSTQLSGVLGPAQEMQ